MKSRQSNREYQGAPKNKGSKAKKVGKVSRGSSKPPKVSQKRSRGTTSP